MLVQWWKSLFFVWMIASLRRYTPTTPWMHSNINIWHFVHEHHWHNAARRRLYISCSEFLITLSLNLSLYMNVSGSKEVFFFFIHIYGTPNLWKHDNNPDAFYQSLHRIWLAVNTEEPLNHKFINIAVMQ